MEQDKGTRIAQEDRSHHKAGQGKAGDSRRQQDSYPWESDNWPNEAKGKGRNKIEDLQNQVTRLQDKLYGKTTDSGWQTVKRGTKKGSQKYGKMLPKYAPTKNNFDALQEEEYKEGKNYRRKN